MILGLNRVGGEKAYVGSVLVNSGNRKCHKESENGWSSYSYSQFTPEKVQVHCGIIVLKLLTLEKKTYFKR